VGTLIKADDDDDDDDDDEADVVLLCAFLWIGFYYNIRAEPRNLLTQSKH
jgi:hypothetical protein